MEMWRQQQPKQCQLSQRPQQPHLFSQSVSTKVCSPLSVINRMQVGVVCDLLVLPNVPLPSGRSVTVAAVVEVACPLCTVALMRQIRRLTVLELVLPCITFLIMPFPQNLCSLMVRACMFSLHALRNSILQQLQQPQPQQQPHLLRNLAQQRRQQQQQWRGLRRPQLLVKHEQHS